jgi:hypothetical protein
MHDAATVFHNDRPESASRASGTRPHRCDLRSLADTPFRAPLPALRRRLRASEWTARAVHPDDGRRLEWDGVDIFPLTAEGRIARKDVYSSSATPRVL